MKRSSRSSQLPFEHTNARYAQGTLPRICHDLHFKEWITRHVVASWKINEVISLKADPLSRFSTLNALGRGQPLRAMAIGYRLIDTLRRGSIASQMNFIIDLNPASNSSSLIFHSAAAPASTNVSRALVLGLVFNDFGGCRFSLISTAVFITIPDNGALTPGAFNYYAHRTYMRIARVDDVSSFKYDVIRPSAQRAVICAQCAVDT